MNNFIQKYKKYLRPKDYTKLFLSYSKLKLIFLFIFTFIFLALRTSILSATADSKELSFGLPLVI